MALVEEIPWLKTGATHYHAQLRLPDKGRARVDYLQYSVVRIYEGVWS